MMFNQFEYFESIKATLPQELNTIHRITGLRELEETLENIRKMNDFMFMVEDDDDGYLSFNDHTLDNGYRTFYIVGRVKPNNSDDRTRVQKSCKTLALGVFKKILNDGHNFGDPCYGFDRNRVDYRRIGPLINNFYGYSFSYVMRDESLSL